MNLNYLTDIKIINGRQNFVPDLIQRIYISDLITLLNIEFELNVQGNEWL